MKVKKKMSKKYVVVEEDSPGCCNLVIWDFLIVAIGTGATIKHEFEIHTVFCIILGILAGSILIILMSKKYIGTVLKIICSIFWTWLILELFGITDKLAGDMIWIWFIRIVLFIICFGLHIIGLENNFKNEQYDYKPIDMPDNLNYTGDSMNQEDFYQIKEECDTIEEDLKSIMLERNNIMAQAKQLESTGMSTSALNKVMARNNEQFQKLINKYNNYINILNTTNNYKTASKTIIQLKKCIISMKTENQYVLNEVNKILYENAHNNSFTKNASSTADIDESLFNGCKTKDDITKRYRKLMQTFHPDNATGDTEMTQKIQNTYEHLIKKYN